DPQLLELARLQAETAVRIEAMRDVLAGRQAELHRAVNERLDSVTHHLNQSMTTTSQHTVENLQKLNERLAVIDNAQRNIADLASQMTSLQSVLANKQQRGAFGQALAAGCCQARRKHRRQIPDCGRDPRPGADVRALRIHLRRIT